MYSRGTILWSSLQFNNHATGKLTVIPKDDLQVSWKVKETRLNSESIMKTTKTPLSEIGKFVLNGNN